MKTPEPAMPPYTTQVVQSFEDEPPKLVNTKSQNKLVRKKHIKKKKGTGKATFKKKKGGKPPATMVASEGEPPAAAAASAVAPRPDGESAINPDLLARIPADMPQDALPAGKCRGGKNYTVTIGDAKIQVQLTKKAFYLMKAQPPVTLEGSPSIAWSGHGSVTAAWQVAKAKAGLAVLIT